MIDVGAWVGLSSLLLSAALAFNGYRSTRVNNFENRIKELEKKVKECEAANLECEANLRRLRSDNDWLMEQLRVRGRRSAPPS